jgi:urease accessory protein
MGFVVATRMLHVSGIAFGTLSHWPAGRIAVRAAGGVIALIGVVYLARAI